MRRTVLMSTLFVASVALFVPSASAQEGAGMAPAPSSRTASASFTSANSGHGRGLGVGAVTMLNGTSGALATWGNRSGGFHVDGFFGLHHTSGPSTTSIAIGGRFWYHLHAASFADFSVGGGLGFTHWKDRGGADDSHNDLSLEVGAQIRAFIVPNVALLSDLGLGATFGDFDDFMIGGQAITSTGGQQGGGPFVDATLGIAYFFE